MEALEALRAHLIKGKTAKVDGDNLIFTDLNGEELKRFPKHTPTAYHSKNADKCYDLLAVYTCYKYASLTFSDYVMKCRSEKATMVSTVDKKELIAYLKGDIETSAQIHAEGEAGKEGSGGSSAKKAGGDDANGNVRKESTQTAKRPSEDVANAKKRKLSSDGAIHPRDKEHKRDNQSTISEVSSSGDTVMKRILEKEQVFRNRTTVLNSSSKKTFENVLKMVELVNAETKEKIEKASKASLLAPVTARKEQIPLSRLMREKIHGTPIIVVPAGFSDLFTMLNAKDFLEDGVYISNMQKKAEGCRKAQSFTVTHEEDGEVYTFKVVDNVSRFRDKDWRCVVGVIVSGQTWQFKGWKWKFPLEVFKKVCGVYIYNQGSQLNEEIKQWDVKILMIHPDKRHLDKVAAKEFWRYLFAFIKLKLQ